MLTRQDLEQLLEQNRIELERVAALSKRFPGNSDAAEYMFRLTQQRLELKNCLIDALYAEIYQLTAIKVA